MHIDSNKTHLSNEVFAKSTRASIRCPKVSELGSLIFWGTMFHIFGPKCHTD